MSKDDKFQAKSLGITELQSRLAALRQKTYVELAVLPEVETDNLKSGKYEVKLTTYRDSLEDGGLQIVVQWYFHIRLGIGRIGADGFTMSRGGTTRDLEEKDLYDFT